MSEFIKANLDEIIQEWVAFAATILPEKQFDDVQLRDDAAEMLMTIAREIETDQTTSQQTAKSQGLAPRSLQDTSAETHSLVRLGQGFNQVQVISEFRALRGTVIRLWLNSSPEIDGPAMYQLVRFNEGIDQAVCESAGRFMKKVNESTDFAVAVLAHDLRNPLNAIMSVAQLLEAANNLINEDNRRMFGSEILESGKQMARLINNLLDFTRTRLGQSLPVRRVEIDLAPVCRNTVAEIAAAYPDRTIQLDCPKHLLGCFDGTRISQMVSNLVANAIQHGDPRTPVIVKVSLGGQNIIFQIHNEGTPIEASALATIFETPIGQRDKGARGNDFGHLGIGLFVVKKIIEAHSGTITVSSTAAAGTTFVASLPCGDSA
ncbi:MAG: sensor histidine kinase [Candidatus Binatia bacterium]